MERNCFCKTKKEKKGKRMKREEEKKGAKQKNRGKSLKLNTVCNQKFRN